MSRRMRSHSSFLKLLYQTTENQRKAIIATLSTEQLEVLSEIALNIYKGVFPNTQSYIKALKSFKRSVLRLGDKTINNSEKKRLLLKRRHFLPKLLKPVIEILK